MDNVVTHRWLRRIALAGVASVLLAGCSGENEPAPSPSSPKLSAPSQASTVPSLSGQGERAEIEAAYTDFWFRSLHTDDKPEHTWHDAMAAVALDPQLTTTLRAMRAQKRAGITVYGDVTARIVSIEVNGDSAKVVDCQDASRTGQADAKTGDRKTVGVPRNPVDADLKRDGGQWKVSRITFPGGTC